MRTQTESKYYDPGNGKFVLIDGQIVERDALRIAEKIKDYDEDLELICLDPEGGAGLSDAPFLVIKMLPNGTYTRILEAWELDDRILERLYVADTQAGESPLDLLVKLEEEKKKKAAAEAVEAVGDKKEMAVAALQNERTTFSFKNERDDIITLKDGEHPSLNRNKRSIS